jgi:hypothetical protein
MAFIATVNFKLSAQSPYYYQLKVYHYKTQAQEALVDTYLKAAYLPALHRNGVKNVGVFKPIATDTADRLIYVFIPFKRLTDFGKLDEVLKKDQQYIAAGNSYLNAKYDAPAYTRIESVLLKAFSAMPTPALPKLNTAKAERVYELRSYEAATESLSLNKIGMFNDYEAAIFSKLNFNAVFYGQVISGSKMPNLMYLTTFNNKADRDQHWKDFGPEYKKIKDLPQYQNNVSKNVTLFLYPTDYSDF